jgi:hypothetical protein
MRRRDTYFFTPTKLTSCDIFDRANLCNLNDRLPVRYRTSLGSTPRIGLDDDRSMRDILRTRHYEAYDTMLIAKSSDILIPRNFEEIYDSSDGEYEKSDTWGDCVTRTT